VNYLPVLVLNCEPPDLSLKVARITGMSHGSLVGSGEVSNIDARLCAVAHAYNPSYSGGRDWENCYSSPSQVKSPI
jgi:hypothetical protein